MSNKVTEIIQLSFVFKLTKEPQTKYVDKFSLNPSFLIILWRKIHKDKVNVKPQVVLSQEVPSLISLPTFFEWLLYFQNFILYIWMTFPILLFMMT